jgi:hypothetical protein
MLSDRTKETIIAASVAASVSGLVSFTLQHSLLKSDVKPAAHAPDAVSSLRACALVCNGHRVGAIQWADGLISRCECDFLSEEER